MLVVGVGMPAASALPGLPDDPKAQGYVGLCNENGRNVTGGSIDAKPFIWKAVATQPPPKAYQGAGENAVLNVYQPRVGVAPAYWSGLSLSAASFYSTPKLPAVQSSYGDASLADVIDLLPPRENGLLVLRVYWGKANYGLYSATYPTTTIQVTGRMWHVVSGGTVACSASQGKSVAVLTGAVPKSDASPRRPDPAQIVVAAAGARSISTAPKNVRADEATRPGGPAAAAGRPSDSARSADPVAAKAESHDASVSWIVWALLGLVAVLAALLALAVRRGSKLPPSNEPEGEPRRADAPAQTRLPGTHPRPPVTVSSVDRKEVASS